ncbi:ribosome biogenesis protein BMS1 homolog [Aotus nancymaae]|uniref:ribosome biogenesis protein BMS1 homolog n=1 Tax=Aotus nancymaae TaxID=37293 RepID=UPI0030FE10B5
MTLRGAQQKKGKQRKMMKKSSEEEDCTAGERDISGSKTVGEGSKAELSPANPWSNHVNLEVFADEESSPHTSDSGHCTADEAFASEGESEESSLLSVDEEDSENEEAIRKQLSKSSQVGSGQKLGSRNLIDETSDIDLLKEEEDYKEEKNYSTEASGALKWKEDLSEAAASSSKPLKAYLWDSDRR